MRLVVGMMRLSKRVGWALLLTLAVGCEDDPPPAPATAGTTAAAAASAAPTSTAAAPAAPPATRQRSAIARTPSGDALWVASQDHRQLFRLPLPLKEDASATAYDLPGPPAQIVALGDRLLVTIRDPGLLLELAYAGEGLVEKHRVEVADDAWGVTVSDDDELAVVTSAWTHTVTGIDLRGHKVRWTTDVKREPRAVVLLGDRAYVSHLVGPRLTRIDGIGGDSPRAKRIELPAAPTRAPRGYETGASLGYSLVADPAGQRLYAPRHALGALGGWGPWKQAWWGASTVDVLITDNDEPALGQRNGKSAVARVPASPDDHRIFQVGYVTHPSVDREDGPIPTVIPDRVVGPRASVYRRTTDTLLVLGESTERLIELEARSLAPALSQLHTYPLATGWGKPFEVANNAGGAAGVVLSADEQTAYVYGRANHDVTRIALVASPRADKAIAKDRRNKPDEDEKEAAASGEVKKKEHDPKHLVVTLAEDPLLVGIAENDPKREFREAAVLGRKLFYNSKDSIMSDGVACSSCHPEGRDDGFVWREDESGLFGLPDDAEKLGHPRQTPMLAGRVGNKGAFGWRGESKDLPSRIEHGFRLHRGSGAGGSHARAIAAFLLKGVLPPPKKERELTATEKRGKAVFHSPDTGCLGCHNPDNGYTDRLAVPLKLPVRAGFASEESKFNTPGLAYVSGTPPYLHDGSVYTLESLIYDNDDRMGKTNQLSSADKAALVAFLKTL